ncbi:hypothetical protein [Pengzhenrongella sicca]|uniref:Uncharacterized protein n=1 Tax=Pengzhenrongella sicca TaxID=2819238 RepID=A0A8A4Z9Z5_9MICO|nr:hypothetical protein [Pengzhenrongella sicca]QTE28732.1 hypothetical protein J4E96_15495 [Pengzhenrongella sicca]
MLQRTFAAVLGILGLVCIGLGVASATVWRASDTLVVTAPAGESGTLVITAPGVLELGGSPVTVTARATGGTKVVLAIGQEVDVAGWVGPDAHTVVTGLADLHTLTTSAVESEAPAEAAAAPADGSAPVEAAPAETPAPDPEGSDMWLARASGATSAELPWTPVAGRWTLLAAGVGDGAGAPEVQLSWPQTVTTPWLVPGVALGALLLLVGLGLGLRAWRRARRAPDADWVSVATGSLSTIPIRSSAANVGTRTPAQVAADDGQPTVILTRRQIREAEAAAAASARSAGRVSLRWRGQGGSGGSGGTDEAGATRTGEVPAVAPAPQAHVAAIDSAVVVGSAGSAGTAGSAGSGRPIDPAGAVPAAVDLTAVDLTAVVPAAAEPPAAEPAPAARSARSRLTGGWTPRRPAPAASDAGPADARPADAAPSAAGAVGGDLAAAPAEPAPVAAPGSRADAWRRAWGFPGEGAEPDPGASTATEPRTTPEPHTPEGKDS